MAVNSKQQYLLLQEALGDAMGQIRKRQSPMQEQALWGAIKTLSEYLIQDNRNFDAKLFFSAIDAIADLDMLDDKLPDLTSHEPTNDELEQLRKEN